MCASVTCVLYIHMAYKRTIHQTTHAPTECIGLYNSAAARTKQIQRNVLYNNIPKMRTKCVYIKYWWLACLMARAIELQSYRERETWIMKSWPHQPQIVWFRQIIRHNDTRCGIATTWNVKPLPDNRAASRYQSAMCAAVQPWQRISRWHLYCVTSDGLVKIDIDIETPLDQAFDCN